MFGTLHTSSAAKTIDRIIDVFPAEEKMVRAMLSRIAAGRDLADAVQDQDGSGRVAARSCWAPAPSAT